MLDDDCILSWLEKVPDNTESHHVPSRKRKQSHQLTPPHSIAMELTAPPTKRQRTGDNDPIPHRKGTRTSTYTSSLSSVSLPPSQQGDIPTGGSSPSRQFMGLRLDVEGLDFRQIETENPPSAAADLLQADLLQQTVGTFMGMDILPRSKKMEISNILKDQSQPLKPWKSVFMDEEYDSLPGHIPTWEELECTYRRIKERLNNNHEEASWNMEVHHLLLNSIFRRSETPPCGSFDFMSCSDLDRMACESLARRTITQTVNHTDYTPLQLRPIVLSIETKRPAKDLDVAQLQMGVWHAAQWISLRSAIETTARSALPKGATEDEFAESVKSSLYELGCLPAVIIQGHRWLFVFSTLEPHTTRLEDGTDVVSHRTILWVEQEFGSTQSMLRMYQAVAGLRLLAKWAQDKCIYWYRKHVLGTLATDQCS